MRGQTYNKSKVLVVFQTRSGNTRTFVDYILSSFPDSWIDVKLVSEEIENIESYDKIIIGTYTWANGKIPAAIKKFVIENREILMGKQVLLFGSGITIYKNFCGALDSIAIILGNQNLPKIKFELTFIPEEHEENIELLEKFIQEWYNCIISYQKMDVQNAQN